MTHMEHFDFNIPATAAEGQRVGEPMFLWFDYLHRDALTWRSRTIEVKIDETDKKQRIEKILDLLDEHYGTEKICYLNHENPWQLLIAVILSAQCTDARVNIVTGPLFERYPDAGALADADVVEVENLIHSVGFYKNKARNIILASRKIQQDFGGEVPSSLEELITLPGVGRKTANVIRGNIYDEPSIVVDTHVKRISNKLGFTKETDPEKVEYALMKVLPKDHWIMYNIQIITLGRQICVARRPKCGECFLKAYCPSCEVM